MKPILAETIYASYIWLNYNDFRERHNPYCGISKGMCVELNQMGYVHFPLPITNTALLEQHREDAVPVEKLLAAGLKLERK